MKTWMHKETRNEDMDRDWREKLGDKWQKIMREKKGKEIKID